MINSIFHAFLQLIKSTLFSTITHISSKNSYPQQVIFILVLFSDLQNSLAEGSSSAPFSNCLSFKVFEKMMVNHSGQHLGSILTESQLKFL